MLLNDHFHDCFFSSRLVADARYLANCFKVQCLHCRMQDHHAQGRERDYDQLGLGLKPRQLYYLIVGRWREI